jgi:hypothetical protein
MPIEELTKEEKRKEKWIEKLEEEREAIVKELTNNRKNQSSHLKV